MLKTIWDSSNKSLNLHSSSNSEETGSQFFITKASIHIHIKVTFSNTHMTSHRAFHTCSFPVKTIAK